MRVFIAGTNAETVKKSDYLLESFFYFKPWQTELLKTTKDFLLDSGAFTFMSGSANVDWEDYIERYCDFIVKYDIKHFFELDIDKIVGYEKVKEYRKTLERKTMKQSIPVWHKSRGIEEYKKLCDEYPYVAIGGIAIRDIKPNQYKAFPALIDEAHKRGAMVHALGFTNVKLLPSYHFDSVDSTRWNCARFGRIEYFDGKTIRPIDKRKQGMRLQGKEKGNGEIIRYTLNEWIKFQKYADKYL